MTSQVQKMDRHFREKYGKSYNELTSIHGWIRYHYGKATRCENLDCPKKSNNFNHALRKGFNYEKNINNFIQLCRSCHSKYDVDLSSRTKSSFHSGHRKLTNEQIREIRKLYGDKIYNQVQLAKIYSVDQSQISNIILRKRWLFI